MVKAIWCDWGFPLELGFKHLLSWLNFQDGEVGKPIAWGLSAWAARLFGGLVPLFAGFKGKPKAGHLNRVPELLATHLGGFSLISSVVQWHPFSIVFWWGFPFFPGSLNNLVFLVKARCKGVSDR